MFMKRNRNVGRRVVYPHILKGARKDLQDHAGHEFEREDKLHQVSNAPMNSLKALPIFWRRRRQLQCLDLKCLRGEGLGDVEVSS